MFVYGRHGVSAAIQRQLSDAMMKVVASARGKTGMWNEARELAVFRAYLQRVPLAEIMRYHGIKDATVSDLVRRRLIRLRQLGLHQALELSGCPLDCIKTRRAPEYIQLYELSRQYLFDDQVEQLWFSAFRKP